MTDYVLITCEHGGNSIPASYRALFRSHRRLLDSHRGYDLGALTMATQLARSFGAPLVASTVSRLLIDLNRSIGHPRLYSEATRNARAEVRQRIIEHYYRPYRTKVERHVTQAVADGSRVIHISSHSFTPELNGKVRSADIGLLYDPARRGEVDLCERWKTCFNAHAPQLNIRRNYPYAGTGDGLTAYLRRHFPPTAYVGIELEINQKHVLEAGRFWTALRTALIESLRMVLADSGSRTANRR